MQIGSEFAGYRVETVLGRGGMGVVYRAEHLRLRRPVALKVLAPAIADNESFRARFVRESQLAASIDDPNIIPIYEAGEADGEFFIAMRYVDGTDLESRLADGPLDPGDALRILAQVASALDAAHAAGLVHRDVKPGNILIDRGHGSAAREHVYLTDFGLTKRADSQSGITAYGSFVGSIDYIAPEQIRGQTVDRRADIYALGCVAYRCLTGRLPFERDSDMAMLWAHVHEAAAPPTSLNPELPADVDGVLARAMAKDPAERQPSGEAFISELRAALAPLVQAAPASAGLRRSLLLAAAVFGGLMLLASGTALAVVGPERLGAMLADSPTTLPEPTMAAAAEITPEPTPPPTPTPDPEALYAASVDALLSRVPSRLRAGCEAEPLTSAPSVSRSLRPPELPPEPDWGILLAHAGVRCVDGPATAMYWRVGERIGPFSPMTAAGHAEEFLYLRASAVGIAGTGICDGDRSTREPWQTGRWSGQLICYRSGEAAIVDWTWASEGLYATAIREDGDLAALVDWWRNVGRLLSQ